MTTTDSNPAEIDLFDIVVRKAEQDADFRSALVANPRKAMLDRLGLALPDRVKVNVIENTPDDLTIVLPFVAEEADLDFEDSDDDVVGFYHNGNFSVNAAFKLFELKAELRPAEGKFNPDFSKHALGERRP